MYQASATTDQTSNTNCPYSHTFLAICMGQFGYEKFLMVGPKKQHTPGESQQFANKMTICQFRSYQKIFLTKIVLIPGTTKLVVPG